MTFAKDARTAFASRAHIVAEMFMLKMDKHTFTGRIERKVRVVEGDGQSTGGGKTARQSITLAPQDAAQPSVVVGWIDVGNDAAEIRSFTALLKRHQTRFGKKTFELKQNEYDAFVKAAMAFLDGEGIKCDLVETAPDMPVSEEPVVDDRGGGAITGTMKAVTPAGVPTWLPFAIAVGVGAIVATVVLLLILK